MGRVATTLAVCASLAWNAHAITKEQGTSALKNIEHLKGIDGSDLACDACLLEVDCIWPCELMCLLDRVGDSATPLSVQLIYIRLEVILRSRTCNGLANE